MTKEARDKVANAAYQAGCLLAIKEASIGDFLQGLESDYSSLTGDLGYDQAPDLGPSKVPDFLVSGIATGNKGYDKAGFGNQAAAEEAITALNSHRARMSKSNPMMRAFMGRREKTLGNNVEAIMAAMRQNDPSFDPSYLKGGIEQLVSSGEGSCGLDPNATSCGA
jgi:hypothetical protein